VIREALQSFARNQAVADAVGRIPGARGVVGRVVAGESVDDVMHVALDLADHGFWLSIEHTESASRPDPDATLDDLYELIDAIDEAGLTSISELSIRPEALGSTLDEALPRLDAACASAGVHDLQAMVAISPAMDTDEILSWFEDQPAGVGITLASALRRSETDCARFADRRVRLVKGGRRVVGSYGQPIEVDKSYVRCAKQLLQGKGPASFATHDSRLIEIVESLTVRYQRPRQSYEFAMYLGRLEGMQDRLLRNGERVRIYLPFGPAWFERLVGGLAEQQSSIGGAMRSLLPGAS
jgi:proline dehydrogenase